MNIHKRTYLSMKEIVSTPTLSDTTISEDGNKVAFVKKTANWKDNTYQNHIWIFGRDRGQCHLLISGDIENTHPLWSPDSNDIAYLSPVGEGERKKNQIFVKSIKDDNEVQVTNEKEGVHKFKWDPTGNAFYYIAPSKESEAIKKRKAVYGDYQHIGKEYQNDCLYFKHETGKVQQLTDGKGFHIQDFEISNDGTKVVFIASPSPDMSDTVHSDLYILHRKTGNLQKLNIDKLLVGNVCFSPDGSKVCYSASIMPKDYYKKQIQVNTIEIYDFHNGETIQPLADFDSTVVPIRWTNKGIFIRWQNKTSYLIGLLSESGTVETLNDKEGSFIAEASITGDGNHLSYNKALPNETFEIYLDEIKITNENNCFNGKLKSNREIISWQSTDGFEIEGILSTPQELDKNKKYPLLVVIHGGPNWASFPIFSDCFNEKYPIEQFIEKGFIVLEPNYRGSSGYGNEFLKANYRKQGIADYEDIISGVDQLVDQGIVDKERVGAMGWSNGGYISAFCSTYSSRFKAISVGGGITNWRTHYVNTDIPYFIRMYLGNDPWDDPEIYAKTSPITYIKSACTPTLIQHGEKDERVPITNAYELYKGLKDMEVETELVVFKGMAYSPDQPGMNVAIMKQNLRWFSHYILGESMEGFRD